MGSTARQPSSPCEWSGFLVCFAIIDRSDLTDYEADEVLVVREPHQLRALGDELRARIVLLVRPRAASITELAEALALPKGTVGHHVKVLENAGLIRVVRTRKVRALTEKYYGRVAKLFVLQSNDSLPEELAGGALAALMLRQAADELIASRPETDESALLHAKLRPEDVRRFQRRLGRLIMDFRSAEVPDGEMHAFAFALFRATTVVPPRGDDA